MVERRRVIPCPPWFSQLVSPSSSLFWRSFRGSSDRLSRSSESLPPITGFLTFALHIPLALLTLIAAVVAMLRTRGGKSGRTQAIIALAVALVMMVTLIALRPPSVPAIHDITTNPDDPPSFVVLASDEHNPGRDLTYPHGGPEVPAQQRVGYPDLEPIKVSASPEQALASVATAASNLGWEVVARDDTAGRLEATDTTGIFRFVDDIVVRVRPDGTGSVVDVRSTSRVGQSDLGANAARIRALRDQL